MGGFFSPLQANAGFFSYLLGDEAHAEANGADPAQSGKNAQLKIQPNSQNISLLQANVSSVSVLQEKKGKDSSLADNQDTPGTANIVSDTSLLPATGALGVSDGKEDVDASSAQTSVYVVRKGDTWSQIADMYDVTVNTILWANDKKKGDKAIEGELLFIPPVSGLEHEVKNGQTCQSIAKMYKVDASDIADYNNLDSNCKLSLGDKLFIPDAQKSEESDKPIQNLAASTAKDKKYYESHPIKNLAGYFINPVPGYRKSQGIHDNNAVDLAISKGTPIHAAAVGTVILARNGYNGGFGNMVIISHPNGTETLYAHQSKIATHTGDQVYQGEVIGYVGSTGHSTGPHLHFEVHGARNPGADGSWAN